MAPLVRTGGSRHTGLAALPHRNIHIYEKIAEKYNTTPEEVRREMQIAIDAGFDNPDPAVQEEWKKMTLKGERPTPEEVINYAVKKLKGK